MSKATALHAEVARHLDEISQLMNPGMRLSFIARDPSNPEADVFISEDSVAGVAAVLERSKARAEVKLTPGDVIRNAMGVTR